MDQFTIKDLENLSGIKAHTLRIWEQRYNLLKPNRTFTNIRYYSNEELKKVLNIALLNKFGFKISHIDKMSQAQINDKILSLTQPDAQEMRLVNELIKHMIDVDMPAFENVLSNFILVRGIERTITQLIFPFMDKIGVLWQTNHINPAQEHLVSNIIRQKLIVGIESANTIARKKKTVLLFLPEGEHHELGLLFINFLLKTHGTNVIYLGSDVPLNDVEYLVNLKKPDYLYTHITTVGAGFNIDKFITTATKKFRNTPFLLSGRFTSAYQKKLRPPFILLKSFTEAVDYISQLK